MTVLEKLNEVSAYAKEGKVLLFREGVFWKGYQEAAYLFVTHIRKYQVNRSYIKKVGADVFSLGFPIPSTSKSLSGVRYEEEGDRIIITLDEVLFDEVSYLSWRQNVVVQPTVVKRPSAETLLVYKHSYDLVLRFYQINRNIDREYKFSLAEKIKDELHKVLMSVCFAADKNSADERVPFINQARDILTSAKIRIRLLYDLRQISLKSYSALAEQMAGVLSELERWR